MNLAKYYVEMAGGLKKRENADTKNIYIIKANGSVITPGKMRTLWNTRLLRRTR